jgi:hypothetical protein
MSLPNDETTFRLSGDVLTVTLLEEFDILSELFESDTVLRSVDEVGTGLWIESVTCWSAGVAREKTYSESTKHSDVTTSSSLSLDDEDSVPRGRSGLLDGVASFDEDVDRRIGPDRPFGDRNVVRDGGGKVDERDFESLVAVS